MKREHENPDSNFAGLEPPRFSLKVLMLLPAILGALIVLVKFFGGIGGALFILASLVLFMHVAGNAIGTQLRDNSDRASRKVPPGASLSPVATQKASEHFAPTTRLSHKSSLGLPLIVATASGSVIGLATGYWILSSIYELPLPVLSICLISAAALGAFCFFWIWSLLHVVTTTWWQAHSSANQDLAERNKWQQ